MTEALKALDRVYDKAFVPGEDNQELSRDFDTIRAALQAQEWRPIESAPRDGTLILLIQDGECHTARWDGYGEKKYWSSNGCIDDYLTFGSPTHWQPLRAPPGEREG